MTMSVWMWMAAACVMCVLGFGLTVSLWRMDRGESFSVDEPLLLSERIGELKEMCPKGWSLNVVTGLNVEWEHIERVIDVVDRWYIDIKDMDSDVYRRLTGKDNTLVVENLVGMIRRGLAERMFIRVPRIPGYNTEYNIEISVRFLQDLGLSNIEVVDYDTDGKEVMITK